MDILRNRLVKAMELTNSLAFNLDSKQLTSRNGTSPSNTIGGQFWCVVGARESYARAFVAGAWQGFSCSLKDVQTPENVQNALASSQAGLMTTLASLEPWDDARKLILFDLLEHEAQHQGQLIRYFYANVIDFTPEFSARYGLEQPKRP